MEWIFLFGFHPTPLFRRLLFLGMSGVGAKRWIFGGDIMQEEAAFYKKKINAYINKHLEQKGHQKLVVYLFRHLSVVLLLSYVSASLSLDPLMLLLRL